MASVALVNWLPVDSDRLVGSDRRAIGLEEGAARLESRGRRQHEPGVRIQRRTAAGQVEHGDIGAECVRPALDRDQRVSGR
jgi:hypothetical protein